MAAGIGLDRWLGTDPWLTAVFSVLGLGSAIQVIFKMTSKFVKKYDKKKGDKTDGGNDDVLNQ
jgi:F0F1-type ATP synthase assembly protein I